MNRVRCSDRRIADAFTTDTGSDDSFLASLERDADFDRKRLDAPATPTSAALSWHVDARSTSSLTELRRVASAANCVDAINHHVFCEKFRQRRPTV